MFQSKSLVLIVLGTVTITVAGYAIPKEFAERTTYQSKAFFKSRQLSKVLENTKVGSHKLLTLCQYQNDGKNKFLKKLCTGESSPTDPAYSSADVSAAQASFTQFLRSRMSENEADELVSIMTELNGEEKIPTVLEQVEVENPILRNHPTSHLLLEGDIVPTLEQARESLQRTKHREKRASIDFNSTRYKSYKWPSTNIKYSWSTKYPLINSATFKADIRAALDGWEANTCLTFTLDETNSFEDGLLFGSQTGCFSYIGRIGGQQEISIGENCNELVTIAHEVGHALGDIHEQSRLNRDDFVTIDFSKVEASKQHNYDMKEDSTAYGIPYDYRSIMHYGQSYFAKVAGEVVMTTKESQYQWWIGRSTTFSLRDHKSMNDIYCSGVCTGTNTLECQNGGYPDVHDCSKCKCADELGGEFCTDAGASTATQDPCGTHEATSEWQSLTFDKMFTGEVCNNVVKSPAGTKVQLQYTSFYMLCYNPYCAAYAEYRLGDVSVMGTRFCCLDNPTEVLESTSNIALFRHEIYTQDQPNSYINIQYRYVSDTNNVAKTRTNETSEKTGKLVRSTQVG